MLTLRRVLYRVSRKEAGGGSLDRFGVRRDKQALGQPDRSRRFFIRLFLALPTVATATDPSSSSLNDS